MRAPLSKPRPQQPSIPTNLIELTPDFMAALKGVAPKKKRSRKWYVVAAVLLAGVLGVAAIPQARNAIVEKGRALVGAKATVAAAAPEPSAGASTATAATTTAEPTSTTLLQAPIAPPDTAQPTAAPAVPAPVLSAAAPVEPIPPPPPVATASAAVTSEPIATPPATSAKPRVSPWHKKSQKH
jgi:hypothetical protein